MSWLASHGRLIGHILLWSHAIFSLPGINVYPEGWQWMNPLIMILAVFVIWKSGQTWAECPNCGNIIPLDNWENIQHSFSKKCNKCKSLMEIKNDFLYP